MTRMFALAVLVAVLGPSCWAADALPTFPSLFGAWKVERMVGAAPITGDDKEAAAALGTTVTISADLISTYDKSDTCKPRDPKVVEGDTEGRLEADFGTRGTGLSLPAESLKPRMAFLEAGCAFALVLDADTLLWPMGSGYLYTVRRQHP